LCFPFFSASPVRHWNLKYGPRYISYANLPLIYAFDFVQPASFEIGENITIVSKFTFSTSHAADSGAIKTPATLTSSYHRYNKLIFDHDHTRPSQSKSKVVVTVNDLSEGYPDLETDESYSLVVGFGDNEPIKLNANTIYGALRGLETLSQLISFDFIGKVFFIPGTPIVIKDKPRYKHRGILVDTSRHFQPIASIRSTIDAMSYVKLNVLHWHIVDIESFPFESKTYPNLWLGAYSNQERYSQSDVVELVEYARQRGVKVMQTHRFANDLHHLLTHSLTQLTHPLTHSLTHPLTYLLTYLVTH